MGRPRKLTAEQEAEVWNRYQSGEKIAKIAKAMNLPYIQVYTSIRRETNGPTKSGRIEPSSESGNA